MKPKSFTARRCSALFVMLGVVLLAGSGYALRIKSSVATTHAPAAVPTSVRHPLLGDTKTGAADTSVSDAASSAPLAAIDLGAEKITARSANVSITPIDFGSDISLTIPNGTAPRSYRISISLSSDESLAVLSTGGAVITQTYPIPPGDDSGLNPPADYQDSLDDDHPDAEADPDEPAAPDDGTENIDDNQDPSWYPDGDAVDTGARDGSVIASDTFDQTSSELPDGNWVMISAFDPPTTTDANGRSVRIALAKASGGLAVSISPSSSAVFPIEVKLAYGFDPDSY